MIWLILAGVSGAIGVILGAAGAHMPPAFPGSEALALTATTYQMWHTLALGLVAAVWPRAGGWLLGLAGGGFALGILLFSGGLYLRAYRGMDLGAVVPTGGTLLIASWILLALAGALALRRRAP